MPTVREATATFLLEHPDAADDLRRVLDIDEERREPWTFHDIPLDSGQFGEVVSRGLVEEDGSGYRVAEPAGVRTALEEHANGTTGTERESRPPLGTLNLGFDSISQQVESALTSVEPAFVAVFGAILVLVAGFRLVAYPSVFRNGDVVLLANDPYFYRYWVEQVLAQSNGSFDPSVLSNLPGGVGHGEPLLVSTLWAFSTTFGGDAAAAGLVLAWYPVVAAIVTGVLVYVLGAKVFDDRRIGLAALAMFAIMPVAVFRMSLGFADHHAFDYPWLALTAVALVALVGRHSRADTWSPSTMGWTVVLGIAVTGQALAWDNSPILLAPMGLYAVGLSVSAVRAGESPLVKLGPLVGGLAVAAAVVWAVHRTLGWHSDQVAAAPALLLVGVVGVAVAGEVVHRLDRPAWTLATVEAIGGVVGWLTLDAFLPAFTARLVDRIELLVGLEGVAEGTGLAAGSWGVVTGPLFLYGFVFYLGLLYLGWCTWRSWREHHPAYLIVVVYTWYFLALALFQVRFLGELAIFVAVVAGLGFVHVAGAAEFVRRPAVFEGAVEGSRLRAAGELEGDAFSLPGRRAAMSVVVLFLLVGSMSFVQAPIIVSTLTIDNGTYQAAKWMDGYAEARGLTYPENYVFSPWSRNRAYNYPVNGESRSYAFARENYGAFLEATDSEGWYQRLEGRVGFIVVSKGEVAGAPNGTIGAALHELGNGTGHYRAVYVDPDGLVIFTPVPGAIVIGSGPANATVTLSTTVRVEGASFGYSRSVATGPDGTFEARVPYPGKYEVLDSSVAVPAEAVTNGSTVDV